MAKIEELNKELNELQARIAEVQKKIEKAKRAEWPQDNDSYWFIDSEGDIQNDVMGGMVVDKERVSIGNTYRTEEEAEFEVERLKVIAELKKFAMTREEVNATRNVRTVFALALDDTIETFSYFNVRAHDLYFESEEIAHEAVKSVGENRVKKYYFGVEDCK